jgi:hypothetical protein
VRNKIQEDIGYTFVSLSDGTHLLSPYSNFCSRLQVIKDSMDVKDRLRLTPPCLNFTNVVKYMNTAEVRKQLHIPDIVQKWDVCRYDYILQILSHQTLQ